MKINSVHVYKCEPIDGKMEEENPVYDSNKSYEKILELSTHLPNLSKDTQLLQGR